MTVPKRELKSRKHGGRFSHLKGADFIVIVCQQKNPMHKKKHILNKTNCIIQSIRHPIKTCCLNVSVTIYQQMIFMQGSQSNQLGFGRSLHSFDISCSKTGYQNKEKKPIYLKMLDWLFRSFTRVLSVLICHILQKMLYTIHPSIFFHCPCPLWLYLSKSKPVCISQN